MIVCELNPCPNVFFLIPTLQALIANLRSAELDMEADFDKNEAKQ